MIKSLRHARPFLAAPLVGVAISQNRVTCTPRFINYSSQSYHGPRVFIFFFIFFFFSPTNERRALRFVAIWYQIRLSFRVPTSRRGNFFFFFFFFFSVSLLPYTRTARVSLNEDKRTANSNTRTREQEAEPKLVKRNALNLHVLLIITSSTTHAPFIPTKQLFFARKEHFFARPEYIFAILRYL